MQDARFLLEGTMGKVSVTRMSVQGARQYQEDVMVSEIFRSDGGNIGWCLGIFDGHGGSGVAHMCANYFVTQMATIVVRDPMQFLARSCYELKRRTHSMSPGSTLSVIMSVAPFTEATVAVIGDSPVYVLDARGGFHKGPNHNVASNIREREEAIARGGQYGSDGYIYNPNTGQGLQLARSLGDAEMEEIIRRDPDIYSIELAFPSAMLVCSDGLLETGGHTPRIVKEAEIETILCEQKSAADLIAWASGYGIRDNTSVIVYHHNR